MYTMLNPSTYKNLFANSLERNTDDIRKRNKIFFTFYYVVPVLIIIVSVFYICYECIRIQNLMKDNDYGIILDAGSNGTRIHLFRWLKREYASNITVNTLTKPNEVYFYRYEASLSDVPLEHIHEILEFLIANVKDVLKTKYKNGDESQWKKYPLYLQATAGMRLLDSLERDTRMGIIRSVLSNEKINPFQFSKEYARVISGEEEGIYGWLSVNSALNTVFAPASNTYGALDLGGSSVQITFFPTDTSILEDFNGIHINNTSIRLYAHSFIGYGWQDAFFRLSVILILNHLKSLTEDLNQIGKQEQDEKEETHKLSESLENEDISRAYKNENGLKNLPKEVIQNYAYIDNLLYEYFMKYIEKKKEQSMHKGDIDINDNSEEETKELKEKVEEETKEEFDSSYVSNIYQEKVHDKYKYNINSKKPYYVEDFIKKIRNFKRKGQKETNLLIHNPCFPSPLKMKIVLPTFMIGSMEFIINEKKIKFSGNKDISYKQIGKYLEEQASGLEVPWDETDGIYLLEKKSIKTDIPLWEHFFNDFKSSSYFKQMKESEYLSKMDENEKEKLLRHIFKNNTIRKNKKMFINFTVQMVGSNDANACLQLAKKLFYKEACFLSFCSFNGVYQPQLKGNKFVVYGQFKKVMRRLGLKKKIDLGKMKEVIEKYCNLNFFEMKNSFNKSSNSEFKQFCWKSIWSYAVLRHGFQFTNASQIISLDNGIDIDEDEEEAGGVGNMKVGTETQKESFADTDTIITATEHFNDSITDNGDTSGNERDEDYHEKNSVSFQGETTGNSTESDMDNLTTDTGRKDATSIFYYYKHKESSGKEKQKGNKVNSYEEERVAEEREGNKYSTFTRPNGTIRKYKKHHIQKKTFDDLFTKIDNVSWTQGYMIYEVNSFPRYIDFRKIEIRWSMLLTVCVILIMIIILLGGYCFKLKDSLRYYVTLHTEI